MSKKYLKSVVAAAVVFALVLIAGLNPVAANTMPNEFGPPEGNGSLTITRIAGDVYRDADNNPIVPVDPIAPGHGIAGVPIRIRQVEFIGGASPTTADLANPTWVAANMRVYVAGYWVAATEANLETAGWIYGVTNATGEVVFANLTQGIYLVQELESAVIGGNTVTNPVPRYDAAENRQHFDDFVVSIPRWVPGEDGEPGEWEFNVRAYPKSPIPEYDGAYKNAVYFSGNVATWELGHIIPSAVASVPHFSATDILPAGLQFVPGSVVGRFTRSADVDANDNPITDWNLVTGALTTAHFDVTYNLVTGVVHIAINQAGRLFLAENGLLGEGLVMFRLNTIITEAGSHRNDARWDIGTPPWQCPVGDPDCPLPVCVPGDDYYPTCIPPCDPLEDPTCEPIYDDLRSFNLDVIKLNPGRNRLPGAVFHLYRELTAAEIAANPDQGTEITYVYFTGTPETPIRNTGTIRVLPVTDAANAPLRVTTNADGVARFPNVSSESGQRLFLHEYEAPAGYDIIEEWMLVVVTENTMTSADPRSYLVTVDVFNNPTGSGWNLPDTGGVGTVVLTIVGLVLVGGGLFLFIGGKKSEDADAA